MDKSNNQTALLQCDQHPTQRLKHYCVTCGNFVCSKCLKKHISHQTLYWDVLVELSSLNISDELSKALHDYKSTTATVQSNIENIFTRAAEEVTKKMEEIEGENKTFAETLKGNKLPDEKLMMLKTIASNEDEGDSNNAMLKWIETQISQIKTTVIDEVNKLDSSTLFANLPIKKETVLHLFGDNSKDLFYYYPSKKIAKKFTLNIPFNIPELANSIQIGNNIYLLGGKRASAYLSTFTEFSCADPVNTWKEKAPMIKPKYAVSPCALGSTHLYVVGGYNGSYLPDTEKFTITTNSWSKLPSLCGARSSVVTGILNKKYLYALGGENGLVNFERLDIEKEDAFEKITIVYDGAISFGDMGCVEMVSNVLFLFGLYGCMQLTVNGNEHKLAKYADMVKNEYFWPYSAACSDKQYVYGVDRYQNIHIFTKSTKKWEIVANSKWKIIN